MDGSTSIGGDGGAVPYPPAVVEEDAIDVAGEYGGGTPPQVSDSGDLYPPGA